MPLLGLLWCAAGAINTPSREGDEVERTQLGEDQIKQQESHISLKGVHVRRFNQNQNIRIGLQIIISKLFYDIYDKALKTVKVIAHARADSVVVRCCG